MANGTEALSRVVLSSSGLLPLWAEGVLPKLSDYGYTDYGYKRGDPVR